MYARPKAAELHVNSVPTVNNNFCTAIRSSSYVIACADHVSQHGNGRTGPISAYANDTCLSSISICSSYACTAYISTPDHNSAVPYTSYPLQLLSSQWASTQ